ncbi:MAG: cytidylate kinase-like family protein [Chloroflexi bacterium]|nr:cytidylate kinase-like family protein [Chloroflexota bacterium]
MTVITLSRELGSQGDRIATLVAERLGLGLVDRERLFRAARVAGVSEAALHELEYAAEQTLVAQILRSLRSVSPTPTEERVHAALVAPLTSPLGGIFSPVLPPASIAIAELVKMLNQVIEKRAREGNVLFLGQGTEVLLRDHPGALHVRIFAPVEQRIAVLQAREGLSKTTALRKIRASDRERAEYVRRFHNARWNDPRLYHLVINTAFVPESVAVDLIVTAARALAAANR